MTNLIPEKRVDKNGRSVTRHVLPPANPSSGKLLPAPVNTAVDDRTRISSSDTVITEISDVRKTLYSKLAVVHGPTFHKTITSFPLATLETIRDRVLVGSKLEVDLYTDIFNQNGFTYGVVGEPNDRSLRSLNAVALTSDMVAEIPWFGWDAVRYTMIDGMDAISVSDVDIDEIDSHRLRSAVLVNIVKDRSSRHENYAELVDFFAENHEAIKANLPALGRRHEELEAIDLDLVKEIIGGIPLSIVDGTL
jgi:hypothetical protein